MLRTIMETEFSVQLTGVSYSSILMKWWLIRRLYTWLTVLTFLVEKALTVKFWLDFRCFKKCSAKSGHIYFVHFMTMWHSRGTVLSLQTTWRLLKIKYVDLLGQVLNLLSLCDLDWPFDPKRYLCVAFSSFFLFWTLVLTFL